MSNDQKVIAILPARLESSRLPRKALKDICGLPMIVHVFKRCLLSKKLDEVYVATDSFEIKEVVEKYGGKVIMTSSKHETGTDRIAEAAFELDAEIIVNIQGDEALVNPKYIDKDILDDNIYRCELHFQNKTISRGEGKTKKKAQQDASKNALIYYNVLN